MGNVCCSLEETKDNTTKSKSLKRPKWKSEQQMTQEELDRKREQFWDTEPHYGGDRVIWDALRVASESDLPTAKVILDSAGIIVAVDDMSVCYDERGSKYELPNYVLSKPTNLVVNPQPTPPPSSTTEDGKKTPTTTPV